MEIPGGGMAALKRRSSVAVKIGKVWVGGNHPIVVQSMTNTDTADSASTVNQVMALARAGSGLGRVPGNTDEGASPGSQAMALARAGAELVRVTVNTDEAAAAVPRIADCLEKFGVPVPIIG